VQSWSACVFAKKPGSCNVLVNDGRVEPAAGEGSNTGAIPGVHTA
jgi:hypothetical protein